MADKRTLQLILTLKDKASAALKKTGSSFTGFNKAVKVAGIAIAASAVAIGTASIKMAADWETSMSNINTLFDDSGASIKRMDKGIKEILKSSPKSAEDLGASAYNIVSAGISDTAEALKVLDVSQKLAVAGLGETTEAVDIVTSAINAFGIDTKYANDIGDSFFLAVKSGKTTVSELAQGFGQVAPLANAMGVSFEDLIGTVSAMTTSGMKASVAYSQVRATLSNLLKPTKEMQELYDELGMSVEDVKTSMSEKGLIGTLRMLSESVEGDTAMLGKMFGSVEGLNAVMMLLNETGDNANIIINDMITSNGILNDKYKEQSETTENQYKILKNKMNVMMMELGKKILPLVIKGMELLSAFIDKATENWDKFTTVLSKVFIAFDKVASAAKNAWEWVKKATSVVGGGISGVASKVGGFFTGKASGGYVSGGTSYVVGEQGPELFTPSVSGNIIPNNKLSSGGGIIINVYGDVSGEELITKVSDGIMNNLRLNYKLSA